MLLSVSGVVVSSQDSWDEVMEEARVMLWSSCGISVYGGFCLLSLSQILHFTQGWGVLVGTRSADAKSWGSKEKLLYQPPSWDLHSPTDLGRQNLADWISASAQPPADLIFRERAVEIR